jgi:hypothetical protein
VSAEGDNAIERRAISVEGEDIVILSDETTGHGKAHVAQTD